MLSIAQLSYGFFKKESYNSTKKVNMYFEINLLCILLSEESILKITPLCFDYFGRTENECSTGWYAARSHAPD